MEMLNILYIAMTDPTKEGVAAMIKPRIRKSCYYAGIWVCFSKEAFGRGDSPLSAYIAWKLEISL